MSRRHGLQRWRIVALVVATVLLGAGVGAGVASAQDYTRSDADTSLNGGLDGGSYYVGQKLFFYDKWVGKVNCPKKFRLEQLKGADEVATMSEGGDGPKALSMEEEPDGDCQVVFDTSGMDPGVYTIYREWDTPTPLSAQVPGGGFFLKAVKTSSGGDGGDGTSSTDGDGSTSASGNKAADSSGEDDTSSVLLGSGSARVPPELQSGGSCAGQLGGTVAGSCLGNVNWSAFAPASLTMDGGVGKPGNELTIQFTMTNTANDTQGYILEITDLPSALTVVSHDDAGGTWNEDRWLFASLAPGDTVKPNLTVRLPETLPVAGSGPPVYNVSAAVETEALGSFVRADTKVAAISNASLCQAIAGTDGVISDGEVLSAVNAWNDGEPLPSVGLVVGDDQVLAIIEAWRDGKNCGGFTLPEAPTVPSGNLSTAPTTGGAMPGS